MSDAIKHECGIVLLRLRKPLQYYIDKYDTPLYAINKLYLLMEKQYNRGQDGAGVANIKLNVPAGHRYISRYRSIKPQPIAHIFKKINKKFKKFQKLDKKRFKNAEWLQHHAAFSGELWLGHLRYGTHGLNSIENCHPMLRQSNWRSRSLIIAGNFNMTNVDELFQKLIDLGQHPKERSDTVTVMEKIGHFLDEETQRQFDFYKDQYTNAEISGVIEREMDLHRVLSRSCRDFDGGYAMAGLTGYGAAFVARDPNGIRPAYYYADDEIVVVASEKPAIKTAFQIEYDQIKEIEPGSALIINPDGSYSQKSFMSNQPKTSCSFERIYFSRGSDPDIYRERKMLGRLLVPQVLEAIDYDLENTVFSYIPNTAETAFLGMMQGLDDYLVAQRIELIGSGKASQEQIAQMLSFKPRIEKLVIKDAKLRTFITDDKHRDEMVSHVYDTTYEVINKKVDTLVLIDDSIVRGTTLERSILTMLNRLEPRRIVIASSSPQIRYPDCYGIDMSKIKEFVAFRAMLELLYDQDKEHLMHEKYEQCLESIGSTNKSNQRNYLKELYDMFSDNQISDKVAQLVCPKGSTSDLKVIFQTVENLHKACPNHTGDWYFTGNYPTPGGYNVVNQAFANFMQGKQIRAY